MSFSHNNLTHRSNRSIDEENCNTWTMNDLSIDREARLQQPIRVPIEGTEWTVGTDGIIYNSRGIPAYTNTTPSGFHRVLIGGRQRYVNKIVLESFGLPQPDKQHTPFHTDGNTGNNALDNLSWQQWGEATPTERKQRFEEPASIYEYF